MRSAPSERVRREEIDRVRGYLPDDVEIARDGEPVVSRASGERVGGYRVDDYLGAFAAEIEAQSVREPEPVLEYAGLVDDEEQVWGPRPKLLATEDGGRRTVVITGRVADRYAAPRAGARDSVPGYARQGFAADRTAMWAVLLCVIVLLVAITSH